jgi:hypothetical protein
MVETEYPDNRPTLISLCEGRSVVTMQKTLYNEFSSTCLSSVVCVSLQFAVCVRDLVWRL